MIIAKRYSQQLLGGKPRICFVTVPCFIHHEKPRRELLQAPPNDPERYLLQSIGMPCWDNAQEVKDFCASQLLPWVEKRHSALLTEKHSMAPAKVARAYEMLESLYEAIEYDQATYFSQVFDRFSTVFREGPKEEVPEDELMSITVMFYEALQTAENLFAANMKSAKAEVAVKRAKYAHIPASVGPQGSGNGSACAAASSGAAASACSAGEPACAEQSSSGSVDIDEVLGHETNSSSTE